MAPGLGPAERGTWGTAPNEPRLGFLALTHLSFLNLLVSLFCPKEGIRLGSLQPAAAAHQVRPLVLGTSFDFSLSGTWPSGWRQLVADLAPCPLVTLTLPPVTSGMPMRRRAPQLLGILTSLCLQLGLLLGASASWSPLVHFPRLVGKCRVRRAGKVSRLVT